MRLIQITSGRGPAECRRVVEQFLGKLIKEVDALDMTLEVIEVYGDYDSVLLSISGDRTDNYIKTIVGTIQWIEKSPLRPNHKRNNWYIGVSVLPNPETMPELDMKHLKFTTMRASGPGGQHVNTSDSAVRLTHIPTGLTVTSSEERSQHMNKKTAVLKLVKMLSDRADAESAKADKAKWDIHNNLERGNPIRVYRAGKLEVKH